MEAPTSRVDETLESLAEAARLNRATPGREGNLVALSAQQADEVLITGDLHGHRDNFERIVGAACLDQHPRRHLVLQEVCHGGPRYPDGVSCRSHALLEDVARLKVRYPERVHFLLGNHELAELSDFPVRKNGIMLNSRFRLGVEMAYGDESERVRRGHAEFLGTCPLGVRVAGRVFVSHSIPEAADVRGFDLEIFSRMLTPEDYRVHGPVFDLVWGRDYRTENARAFASLLEAQILINGHEPCQNGFRAPNSWQIILDCCGSPAACVIVPTDCELPHDEILKRVQVFE